MCQILTVIFLPPHLIKIAPIIREADEGVLTCRVYITPKVSNEHISDSLTIKKSIILQIEGIIVMCVHSLYIKLHLYCSISAPLLCYIMITQWCSDNNTIVQYYLRDYYRQIKLL